MAATDNLHPQLFSGYGRPENKPPAVDDKPGALPHLPNDEWERRGGSWGPTAHDGEQLPMFMSANQIQAKYQPLDADREGWGGGDMRTTRDSGGATNYHPTARTGVGHNTRRTTGGSKLYMKETVETADEVWHRKADEAVNYGLTDQIREEGVQKPVSLGTQFGDLGKPQVVGGHHRIAAMAEESPDELMPVLHFESMGQALRQGQDARNGRGGWQYT